MRLQSVGVFPIVSACLLALNGLQRLEILPIRPGMTAASQGIASILFWCSCVQMRRVYAFAIVTAMTDELASSYPAVMQFKSNSMCEVMAL